MLSEGTLDGYGCVGNHYYEPLLPWKPLSVAMVTKIVPFESKNSTNWQCCTPLTRPSERVKALVSYTHGLEYYNVLAFSMVQCK